MLNCAEPIFLDNLLEPCIISHNSNNCRIWDPCLAIPGFWHGSGIGFLMDIHIPSSIFSVYRVCVRFKSISRRVFNPHILYFLKIDTTLAKNMKKFKFLM